MPSNKILDWNHNSLQLLVSAPPIQRHSKNRRRVLVKKLEKIEKKSFYFWRLFLSNLPAKNFKVINHFC